MSEILNDENVMLELEQKVKDFEQEIRDFEQKRRDLEQKRRDLDQKRNDLNQKVNDGEVIADYDMHVEDINAQIYKVSAEIKETTAQILEKGEKIKSIGSELLEEPEAPLPPEPPVPPQESEYAGKIRAFDERISKIEREIEILENKKSRFEDTYNTIEEKLNGDMNDATRERLEEMQGEMEDKIGELDDEISELQDKIDEINDERGEFEEEYVDEDIIGEIENMPGFRKFEEFGGFEYFNGYKGIKVSKETKRAGEINIELIDEMKEKYAGVSNEQRELRRRYRRENKYNVNFCSGAKIDSFCCCYNANERPEYLINDDGLKTKWCATGVHATEIAQPYWVIIDLGDVKTFNYVQIVKGSEGRKERGRRGLDMSAWRIEVSEDKENWMEFNRETNDKSTVYEKQFEPVSGRYVRLLIDAGTADPNNKVNAARICAFKIKMRDETGAETAETEDLTKSARVTMYSHCKDGEHPENILNDDMRRRWFTGQRQVDKIIMPHWVIIDFGESRTFNHLRMVKASEGQEERDRGKRKLDMSAWRFEVSEDKENWAEFNRETNDQSSIYIKTFEPVTGRYVRLLIDAGEANPNNKRGAVRIYDLRIEMLNEKPEDRTVTFDDIIAIAPFAKKETLDKLADKLAGIEIANFSKIKEVAQFLSADAVDKLIIKAFEKDDFNAIFAFAPYTSRKTIEKIALDLDSELEFDKIKALAPFLGREAITGILLGGDKVDMRKLRELAPFLGSALIDEIVQRIF